ncbi:group II intron reverse transcriptase/maturase [Desulfosarcina ovata]|uniref:Group II intron reverse transcriptase/maturase n=1 Tax=Desulfosarcina ovata subsp. ovata TaxID=2752305 RepID=A0A5K8AHF5_9BACT|nr:group II intron reverse transcriptase/maturase [Desulfosarcina ovata]BBO91988.1 group II intron reverse transcriptase/maturase [Desulfosarcina ovata subsp. ovata]
MTAETAGALKDDADKWSSVDWKQAQREVRRLQVRIAKAVKENRWNKVRSLQYLLTHSFYAKLLAVKRVTSNKGKKTPGVDGVLWQGARAKWRAANSLRRRGYRPQPLRRIYIKKKNGKLRPLSIPTMYDRAQQALYKLGLAPVAETTADRNSYGFREGRSCADAVASAFNALSKPNSAPWVLEGDIKGCFDNISFKWVLENIPMDKVVLQKWLRAGYMENGTHYPSRKGVPQGGIISPTISNMVLDGLEEAVHRAVPRRRRINFVRYADDFIITGKSKTILEDVIRPVVENFLAERGLELSAEKTMITHIKDGFTFLGQTFRKHGRVLHITPSTKGVHALMQKVGTLIRKHVSAPMPVLIKKLNATLRGWANYHRHVVASEAFSRIDTYVYEQLWRMIRKRHRSKSAQWLTKHYWSAAGRNTFAVLTKTAKNGVKLYRVLRTSAIGIRRHVKIKADANPYLPKYAWYFWRRRHYKASKLLPAMSAREYRAMVSA